MGWYKESDSSWEVYQIGLNGLLTGVKLNIQIQLLIGNQFLGKILMEMAT